MYRNWFDSIYQTKNLVKARIEYIDGDGKTMGLTSNDIGDDVFLHVRDGLTGQMFHFPCRILAIRLSTEVWYDLFVYTNEEQTLGMRVNRVRGETISAHPLNENPEQDFNSKELAAVLTQAVESGELQLESAPEEELTPSMAQETPITWFNKQFYIFRPLRMGTSISRLFIHGKFDDIIPVAQIGDDVMIGDGDGGRLADGVVAEIHVEDEFYYSVAIPIVCPQGERYVVLHKLHVDDIRPLVVDND
jgi:hypothetical protein